MADLGWDIWIRIPPFRQAVLPCSAGRFARPCAVESAVTSEACSGLAVIFARIPNVIACHQQHMGTLGRVCKHNPSSVPVLVVQCADHFSWFLSDPVAI